MFLIQKLNKFAGLTFDMILKQADLERNSDVNTVLERANKN